jgi:hypothetical protein
MMVTASSGECQYSQRGKGMETRMRVAPSRTKATPSKSQRILRRLLLFRGSPKCACNLLSGIAALVGAALPRGAVPVR